MALRIYPWVFFILAWRALAAGSTPSPLTLTSSVTAQVFGRPVTLTARVDSPIATGRVTFFDGSTILGARLLVNRQAVLTTSMLTSGVRLLQAFYSGDGVYAASTSAPVEVKVNTVAGGGFAPAVTYDGDSFPEAIGLGDFNGDGHPDLVTVNFGNALHVLLGNGDGTFQSPIANTIGQAGGFQALAVGDFNGDGKDDVVVIRHTGPAYTGGTLVVLLGNGDGTFQQGASYPAGREPKSVVIGDFNGDGVADLAIANYEAVSVFLGNGDGSFQPRTEYAVSGQPQSIAVGVFNRNGKVDLAVVTPDFVTVLAGNGDGTFRPGPTHAPGGWYVVAADFNGDYTTDLAVASDSSLLLYLGNGDGTFSLRSTVEGRYQGLAVADFNGDGIPDLVDPSSNPDSVSVLLGNGDGTFRSFLIPACCAGGLYGYPTVVVADFNGDGRADAAVTSGYRSGVEIFFRGIGMASQTTLTTSPNPSQSDQSVTLTATVSPLDAKGYVTFSGLSLPKTVMPLVNGNAAAVVDHLTLGNYVYTAAYSGDFSYAGSNASQTQTVLKSATTISIGASVNPAVSGQNVILTATLSSALATGTVTFSDGDVKFGMSSVFGGTAALAVSTLSAGSHSFTATYGGDNNFAGSTSAVFTEIVNPGTATVTTLAVPVQSATLGQAVSLTGTVSPADAAGSVTFVDGATVLGTKRLSGGQASIATTLLPAGMRSLRAYFSGGGGYMPSGSAVSKVIVKALPANGFLPMVSYPLHAKSSSSVAGDFNGDGISDLAIVSGNSVGVLLGNGDGNFQPAVYYDAGTAVSAPVAADFNLDGKTDIAVSTYGGVLTFLGNGDGTFQPAILSAGASGSVAIAADLNGDGIPDLAVGGYSLTILLGMGDGRFTSGWTYSNTFSCIAAGDFNGDGAVDLAGCSPAGVSVLLGNGDGSFQATTPYRANTPFSIAVGDLNGDGNLDLAVGDNIPGNYSTMPTGHLLLLLGSGYGGFRTGGDNAADVFGPGSMVAVSDFNGDGKADVAVTGNQTALYFGHGNGQLDPPVYKGGDPSLSIAVGDFSGDGLTDMALVSDASVGVVLGQASTPTGTALSSSLNPSNYGEDVTLSATVLSSGATGSVGFYDITANLAPTLTALGSATLAEGLASVKVNLLSVNTHSLQAVYGGDGLRFGSRSPVLIQTVNQGRPTITLSSSLNPAAYGESIKLVATVTPAISFGTVTFMDGDAIIGSSASNAGIAQLVVSTLAVGAHTLRASYGGNANDALATTALIQTINAGLPVDVTLTSSANPALYGQRLTLTAGLPTDAAGTVTFYDGAVPIGNRDVSNGQAVLSSSLVGVGVRSLKAYYSGDGHYAPGISASLAQTVKVVGANGFQAPVHYDTSGRLNAVVQADFNGDGVTDLVVTRNDGSVDVLLGNGDGTFQAALNVATGLPGTFSSIAIGDFNGDSIPDLAVTRFQSGVVGVLTGKGDGTFGPAVQYSIGASGSSGPLAIVAGDFNGDGRDDLAIATDNLHLVNGNLKGGPLLVVFLSNGGDTFRPPLSIGWDGAQYLAVGDFNGDGKLDLVAGGFGLSVLAGNGDGTFRNPVNIDIANFAASVAVADFNGDGKADIAVAAAGNTVGIVLGNGNGTFQPLVPYLTTPSPDNVAVGDFNGDGVPDLVVLTKSDVNLLTGRGDGTFEQAVNFSGGGNAVLVGEFNGDGHTDLAIGSDGGVSVLLARADASYSVSTAGVVNAAAFTAGPVAPGSKASLWGNFLVNSMIAAPSVPLPTELGGYSITFSNGLRAPLFSVSRGQITFQVPWESSEQSKATFSVGFNGQMSAAQEMMLTPTAPAIFTTNGQGTAQGMIYDSANRLVDASNPATVGSVIRILCTGLGVVTNQPASGAAAPGNPASVPVFDVTVWVDNERISSTPSSLMPGPVGLYELVPGSVGLYELDVVVPVGTRPSSTVHVYIYSGSASSNVVTIAVR